MATTKKATAKKSPTKDPKGGLTAAGRKKFKETEGANLKPGVKGTPKTPEEMRRKGSFLRRHFANPAGPLVGEDGEPTRLALSAHAWGEKVPKTEADARKLANKGTKLLEQYKQAQGDGGEKAPAVKKPAANKPASAAKAKTSTTAKKTARSGGK